MRVTQLTIPDTTPEPPEYQQDIFKRHILENSEICDRCFTQIREIGEIIERSHGQITYEKNAFYERTTHGTQEHTSFHDVTDRYGECFCERCGAGSHANLASEDESLEQLSRYAIRIMKYLHESTDYTLSGEIIGQSLKRLKSIPENGGYDTEILCVAIANGLRD